jgi:hypothetical protein
MHSYSVYDTEALACNLVYKSIQMLFYLIFFKFVVMLFVFAILTEANTLTVSACNSSLFAGSLTVPTVYHIHVLCGKLSNKILKNDTSL